ncbi:MAG: DUF4034 domain-containing protein [Terracidiphilus sp.]
MLTFRCPVIGLFANAFLLALLLAIAGFPGPSAPGAFAQTAPAQPVNAVTSAAVERTLRLQWRRLFDTHSWTELDSLANRLRNQRPRFQGGGWQLHVLYTILCTSKSKNATDAAWEAQITALQQWIRHSPSSPTPRIALADTYENFAWKARGSGFADAVTPEAWNLLGERMQKALQVLQQAEKISHDDPEWYNSMLVATSDQDWNRAQADALVDEALSKEPGYFYVLRVQADNLLPKWYGNPGDTEEFIAKAADRIGGAEGDASYFFVAEATLVAEERCSQCTPPAMSWTRIRQGYAAVERLYGTNNYERNAIAFLAVRARDAQTARDAFERIGDDWDPDVWGSKALFDSGRLFSNLKPVPHAPPKGARTTY